jgi:Amt family ammonium transporter
MPMPPLPRPGKTLPPAASVLQERGGKQLYQSPQADYSLVARPAMMRKEGEQKEWVRHPPPQRQDCFRQRQPAQYFLRKLCLHSCLLERRYSRIPFLSQDSRLRKTQIFTAVGGWLSQLGATMGLGHGYVDFAGSTVVHAVGGFCAMALAVILGPRLGKYGPDGKPRAFPAHNVVFVVTGTFILLFGWMGFNPGSTLGATDLRIAVVAVNTNLAAVSGSAAAMIFWYFAFGKPDISMACNGMLAGLVAITAPCAFVGPNSAVIIGLLAGLLVCGGVLFNERVLKVDDPCGAISVHGYCGWLGAVCVGIFADGTYGAGWNGIGAATYLGKAGQGVTGLLYGDSSQFVLQLAGATLCALYAFGLTFVVFSLVNAIRSMRVDPEVELAGLDVPEFGMLAYPEDEAVSDVFTAQ